MASNREANLVEFALINHERNANFFYKNIETKLVIFVALNSSFKLKKYTMQVWKKIYYAGLERIPGTE